LFQVISEDRGVSWSIGGIGNWKKFVTIPNLLKVFNQNLYGYSNPPSGNCRDFDSDSVFDVAKFGAKIDDLPRQARALADKMLYDLKVDLNSHWKLITIMAGSNDFCASICLKNNITKAKNNIVDALMILKSKLPRTLINLFYPPNPMFLHHLTNLPFQCKLVMN
jgi:hypothetical protein